MACELKSGDDNVTVVLHSPDFHQTLLASHAGEGVYRAQYLRPSWPYSLTIFINRLPSEDSPYRINPDPHAKGRAKGGAHGGMDGGGTRYESALPQGDAMVQGRGGAGVSDPSMCPPLHPRASCPAARASERHTDKSRATLS